MQTKSFEFKYKSTVTENGVPVMVDGKEKKEEKTGVAECEQFENVVDILGYYEENEKLRTEKNDKGETIILSADTVVTGFVNDFLKARAVANKRAELTRGPNLGKAVKDLGEKNADFQKELLELMSRYGAPLTK